MKRNILPSAGVDDELAKMKQLMASESDGEKKK